MASPAARLTLLGLVLMTTAAEARHLSQLAATKPANANAPAAPAAKPANASAAPASKPANASAVPAAKPANASGVPAGALEADTLYIQNALKATVERLPNGEYKLVMSDLSPTTVWVTDRPKRQAGVLTHDQFLTIIGASRSNPVNGALVSSPIAGRPPRAVPIIVHDGAFKNGQLIWFGHPLDRVDGIVSPGADRVAKLKTGQKLELFQPSLFLDGAARPHATHSQLSMAGVEAGLEGSDDASKVTATGAALSSPVSPDRRQPGVDVLAAASNVASKASDPGVAPAVAGDTAADQPVGR